MNVGFLRVSRAIRYDLCTWAIWNQVHHHLTSVANRCSVITLAQNVRHVSSSLACILLYSAWRSDNNNCWREGGHHVALTTTIRLRFDGRWTVIFPGSAATQLRWSVRFYSTYAQRSFPQCSGKIVLKSAKRNRRFSNTGLRSVCFFHGIPFPNRDVDWSTNKPCNIQRPSGE